MGPRWVKVSVESARGQAGVYVARYHSELLRATHSVEFEDNVMGGIVRHGFAGMRPLK